MLTNRICIVSCSNHRLQAARLQDHCHGCFFPKRELTMLMPFMNHEIDVERTIMHIQTDEIVELAGCDFLTISPALLDKLQKSDAPVEQKLSVDVAKKAEQIEKVSFVDNEPEFRWALLQDQMAFDKLHEGIYKFAADAETLKDILKEHLKK